jgi:hypothetical protein
MSTERDRVISLSLSEAEWQALIARHPRPVDWIREQILDQLGIGPSKPAVDLKSDHQHRSFMWRV